MASGDWAGGASMLGANSPPLEDGPVRVDGEFENNCPDDCAIAGAGNIASTKASAGNRRPITAGESSLHMAFRFHPESRRIQAKLRVCQSGEAVLGAAEIMHKTTKVWT
jgi:hypothetical protein